MTLDPANLTIIHYPAAVLKQRAKPVENIDDRVRAVAQRMIELMTEEQGLGLAAPQVGVPWRMFVTRDDPATGAQQARVYINPTLKLLAPDTDVHEEGCLSLPGLHVDIVRPKAMAISATGLDGQPFEFQSDQFIARVWQHEVDHLNGVLIIDKMSPIDRLAKRKQIKELEASARKVPTSPMTGVRAGQGAAR